MFVFVAAEFLIKTNTVSLCGPYFPATGLGFIVQLLSAFRLTDTDFLSHDRPIERLIRRRFRNLDTG